VGEQALMDLMGRRCQQVLFRSGGVGVPRACWQSGFSAARVFLGEVIDVSAFVVVVECNASNAQALRRTGVRLGDCGRSVGTKQFSFRVWSTCGCEVIDI
jgi:hypothetical protein